MYRQPAERFPGAVFDGDRVVIDQGPDFETRLEQLQLAYLEDRPEEYEITAECAAGLHAFLAEGRGGFLAVKGQLTGPISWGLGVTGRDGRAIIYDETLADAAARFLRLKATWQERALRRLSPNTIIFLDEPTLASLGSAFVSLPREKVTGLISEVLAGVEGPVGLHCCGATDWPLLLSLPIDILSFDAYHFADSLSLYPGEVLGFLKKGGSVAWGVVPNEEDSLDRETGASLEDRLGEAVAPFTRNGISYRDILAQSLITPCCGLANLPLEVAEKALGLLNELSARLRQRL
jgi:methionine synthase II (cobalamin-independent)